MTDVQASIGMGQLARLDEFNTRRAELAARYTELLAETPEVETPAAEQTVETATPEAAAPAEEKPKRSRKPKAEPEQKDGES
jgi:dTDP-4-amino-4,6-dideoxygalactose transaminase